MKGCIKETIKPEETKKEATKEKGKGGKAGKAEKKSKISKETNKNKKSGIQQYPDQLTEAEQTSLGNFTKQSGKASRYISYNLLIELKSKVNSFMTL